ncbi:JmjC domain-containing protein [Streptacidiphilus neutrinimicus]|uniref:JmjC domain-containing protein n=1 Tax=Streptacidiphilus neutrinimicus TaxID=105420 RepID=UPI0005A7FCED|nr:cupin domain-containing protein [Streptacidiphilus neutrinimicus]
MSDRTGEAPTTLAQLVGDVDDFFQNHWGSQPVVFRSSAELPALISEEEMWEELDCGLLIRPYFTAFDEGVRSAVSDMTRRRHIAGHVIPGYVNEKHIREEFAAGGTFKFSQAEHWHPRIRALVKGLEPEFRAGLEAFVFLSPPGKTAIAAHMDGAHVFVLQVAGIKDWVVGRLDETSISDSTRYTGGVIPADRRVEVTLRPGDVLYMPHGTPHSATARLGNSIHVAITIEEPSTQDLAQVFLAELLDDPRYVELTEQHHQQTPAERFAALRAVLTDRLENAEGGQVLKSAVRLKAEHLG